MCACVWERVCALEALPPITNESPCWVTQPLPIPPLERNVHTSAHTLYILTVFLTITSLRAKSQDRFPEDHLLVSVCVCVCVCVCRYIFQEKLKMYTRGQRQRGETHTICSLLSSSWRSMLFVLLHKHPPSWSWERWQVGCPWISEHTAEMVKKKSSQM